MDLSLNQSDLNCCFPGGDSREVSVPLKGGVLISPTEGERSMQVARLIKSKSLEMGFPYMGVIIVETDQLGLRSSPIEVGRDSFDLSLVEIPVPCTRERLDSVHSLRYLFPEVRVVPYWAFPDKSHYSALFGDSATDGAFCDVVRVQERHGDILKVLRETHENRGKRR